MTCFFKNAQPTFVMNKSKLWGREIVNLDFFAIFLNLHNTKQQLIC